MYGKVQIGDREVELVANAASPYRFKQIFREDFLKRAIETNENEAESIDLFVKMGFIMAKQAEKADFSKLNEDVFIAWLEEFEPNDVQIAAGDIANIYSGNAETKVSPKRKAARRSEK